MSFIDQSNGLVWKRAATCSESEDDVWDDTALIKAYDRAVNRVNQKLMDSKSDNNQRTSNNSKPKKSDDSALESTQRQPNSNDNNAWRCGQYCRTVYNEDGIEYESQIISINEENNTCVVKYVGYGNEEEKSLNDLKPSLGKRTRKIQSQNINNTNSDTDNDINESTNKITNDSKQNKPTNRVDSSSTSSWFMPSNSQTDQKNSTQPIVPPPLPFSPDSQIPEDDESLASMLMSWYMSGYHTGYYRALKQFRLNCKCNK